MTEQIAPVEYDDSGRPKKATKNPDQSVQSSIPKNSPSLYHMEGGMQVAN